LLTPFPVLWGVGVRRRGLKTDLPKGSSRSENLRKEEKVTSQARVWIIWSLNRELPNATTTTPGANVIYCHFTAKPSFCVIKPNYSGNYRRMEVNTVD
jgi:hypothetical protein